MPLGWCHLRIWGYWYFSQQSCFQLVLYPAWHFSWCSLHMLNKQGDNIYTWCTLFPIWNQSVVPCPVLTVAPWPVYRFLWGQVRRSGIPISWRIFHSLLWSRVWINPGSWWWTGRTVLLQSMGSQRVRHDWATELNWIQLRLWHSQ